MRRTYQKTVKSLKGKRREKHEVVWSIDKPESHKPGEWGATTFMDRQTD